MQDDFNMANAGDEHSVKRASEEKETTPHTGAGRLFFGIIVILIGAILLLGNVFGDIFSIAKLWPLFILIPGLGFFALYFQYGASKRGVLIPGTVLVYIATYFLYLIYAKGGMHETGNTWYHFLFAPAAAFYLFFFASKGKDWGVLIPAVFLTVLGIVFSMEGAATLLPAALLITIGVMILIGPIVKKINKNKHNK